MKFTNTAEKYIYTVYKKEREQMPNDSYRNSNRDSGRSERVTRTSRPASANRRPVQGGARPQRPVSANRSGQRPVPTKRRRKKNNNRGCVTLVVGLLCVLLVVVAIVKVMSGGESEQTAVTTEVQQQQAPKAREYNIPDAAEENDLLKIAREAQGTEGTKICYLTFDDGPTKEVTPQVLDVLKKYDVKATFFCLGKMLSANRDIAEREHNEGHMLANHSYYHEYKDLYATQTSFMDEINKTQELINEISGEDTLKLIRFPGGSYNAGDHAAEKQVYKKVLKEQNYYYADWNCLNGDAEAALRDVSSLVSKVKNTATEDNIVVLMHDAAAKTTTPQALGEIIEYLKAQGYEFRRMDEIDYYDNGTSAKEDPNSIIL